MPVYNGEAHVGEAISSVFGQTYRPLELIVIDDGSTDETAEVVRRCASPLLKYIQQPHAGTGAARNRGVGQARGDLVGHLDADDVWDQMKLDRQVAALEAHPEVEMVSGHIVEFYSPELSTEERRSIRAPRPPLPAFIMSAVLHRRRVLDRVGLWETKWRLGQDLSWHLRADEIGVKMHMLPDIVVYRRLHVANKGRLLKEFSADRLRVLKESLDRRRAQSDGCGS